METKSGYKFRAPESGRGSVHALYYRIAALVNDFYGDHSAKQCERFRFMENVSYENGEPYSTVSLSYGYQNNPDWIQFTYDSEKNRIFRSESGEPFMTRTLSEHGDTNTTEQMNVQNLIVKYCNYGSDKNDSQHRRTCEKTGSGKCIISSTPARDRHSTRQPRMTILPTAWTTDRSSSSNRATPGSRCIRRTPR